MTRPNTLTRLVRPACLLGGILLLLIAVAPVSAQGGGTHTVQAGENLFRIALRYGVRWDVLARLNGIINPNRIFIGQVLLIP